MKNAATAEAMVCLEMDANSMLGNAFIVNDPNDQSHNGKKLEHFILNNNLIVVNDL